MIRLLRSPDCASLFRGDRELLSAGCITTLTNYGGGPHEIADDSCNLFRNNVMDHVPCAGHLGERAPGQFCPEAPALTIAVDNLATEPRHDRDRERQFGMVLCQGRRTRDHE